MKVPSEIIAKYELSDIDTERFLELFDEPEGSSVLEVGAHDEPVANMLAECGFRVTGVDLREYNPNQDTGKKDDKRIECNYVYLRNDFCDLPRRFFANNLEAYDTVISLSAIEHFGYGTYQEGGPSMVYDIIAMRTIWQLLKYGGTAYITVPYSGSFVEYPPHWRIYDRTSLRSRIVQDFRVENIGFFLAGELLDMPMAKKVGEWLSIEEAESYKGLLPHISAYLKLRKERVIRLAPDGR